MRTMLLATCALALAFGGCSSKTPSGAPAGNAPATGANPTVEIATSKGTIELELFADKAPIGVKNFLAYVDKKQYDGTIFHRVIPDFMIQGGGFSPEMTEKPTDPPIKNEAGNGLKNERYTLAYARRPIVDSATCQFFINLKHNLALDHRDESPQGFGYAVFGKVTKGMEVVDAIAAVPTTTKPPHANVPVEPVVIQSVKVKGK